MTRPKQVSQWLRQPTNFASCAALACWIAVACEYLSRTLFRLWFFSSDEYVVVGEVIRFCHLDFHQHFFDNPGTFFMFLNALLWGAYYGVERAIGATPGPIGPFTFDHLPALFTLARAATLVFFLLSVILTFVLTTRVVNACAGAVASLLLAMSPIYCSYSSFVRTDSLALVCTLTAILLVFRRAGDSPQPAERSPLLRDRIVLAGIFVGLAAGARLHSATAAFPILLMLLWTQAGTAKAAYPDWIVRGAKIILPLSWAAAVFILYRGVGGLG
jgi:predicted membrane-bound mannosyltransferase